MVTTKLIRSRSQRKIGTYSKRVCESSPEEFGYPSFYEVVVPDKHIRIFIQTFWLDAYSKYVALKVADESHIYNLRTSQFVSGRNFFNPPASSTVEVYFI